MYKHGVLCGGCAKSIRSYTESMEEFKGVIKEEGWRFDGIRWYCPDCVKLIRRKNLAEDDKTLV